MKICIVYDDDELHCTCKYIHVCDIDVWIVQYTCRQQFKKRQNWFSFKILTGFLSCILLCVWTPWWKNHTAIQFSAIIILYKTKILRLCNQIITSDLMICTWQLKVIRHFWSSYRCNIITNTSIQLPYLILYVNHKLIYSFIS